MALLIRIDSNLGSVQKRLARDARAHPGILQDTLTALARSGQTRMTEQLPKDIDRPTPFTRHSIGSLAAKRTNLVAELFVKRRQAEYLAKIVFGGTRRPLRQFVFVPARTEQTNPYGNMPRARRRRTLSSDKLVTKRRGRSRLLFERRGKTMTFVGVFVPRTYYPQRTFKFFEHGHAFASRDLPGAFNAAWARRFRA